MKLPGQRLDQAISSLALALSTASLICLIVVFIACTSPSAPESLYFLKVNTTGFPRLKHATNFVRHDIDVRSKAEIPDEVIGHNNVMGSVANNAAAAAEGVSITTTAAIHDAGDKMNEEAQKLSSQLFQFYSVGLWSYCMKREGSKIQCSHPSTAFMFDFSTIFGPLMKDVRRLVPTVDWGGVSGYHRLARTIIWLYITALVTNALTALIACRKVYSLKGGRLLAVMSFISSLFILAATVGSSILCAIIVACAKRTVADIGVQISIGTQNYVATWLATAFSLGALVIWLIQQYCCCI